MNQEFMFGRQRWRVRSSLLHARARLYLACGDIAAIALAFTATIVLRGVEAGSGASITFAYLLLPAYLVVAINQGAYSGQSLRDPFRSIRMAAKSLIVALSLMILVAYYAKSSAVFPRLTVGLGSALALFLLAAVRYLVVRNIARLSGGNPFGIVIIHDGDAPLPALESSLVIAAGALLDPTDASPTMYNRLASTFAGADRVIVACPPERRDAWARALQGAHIQGEIAMPELARLSPLGLGIDRDAPTIIVTNGPLNLRDRAIKRAFDLAVSSTALIVLAPLMLAIALWIKLESPGPVFFRQIRIGRGNSQFEMLKFRSMRAERGDSNADRLTSRDDDRVTRAGRFLRRTSLDELPQLLHVFLGDMSIVGPRPHALGARAASKLYWEVDARYWDRHAAKPGLTGLAQVRGFRGNTFEEKDLQDRLQSDLEYLDSWSIWRDLKIIFMTLSVLFHRNAF